MGQIILTAVVTVLTYMTVWFVIAQLKKRNDVADIAWGPGFLSIAIALMVMTGFTSSKYVIATVMVGLWAFRLATHIALRHRSGVEDGRYQDMRKKWKYPVLQAYSNVFLSQGFFMLLVAAPILLLFATENAGLQWYNLLGLVVWTIGLTFEAVGDWQLKQFITTKKDGEIMMSGLWQFTRHPNYFGEISLWWGFYLFTAVTEYWYVGLIGPIAITYLIIGVSGIPMLERRYEGNKAYDAYKKKTSAFFPLPPKN